MFITLSYELQWDVDGVANDHEYHCGHHSDIDLVCDKQI
jgi:hypothetical protein